MLSAWYYSKEWQRFRETVKLERIARDGALYCDFCHKQILKPYDAICHHVKPLTESNYMDVSINLNPDNIQVVHHACHEAIHRTMNVAWQRKVYLVWGSPKAGKTEYVKSIRNNNNLVVDIAELYRAIGSEIGNKAVSPVVFRLRDELLDMIKVRYGKWDTAYVIGTYPIEAERERLLSQLGAEEIHIDTDMETCLSRCETKEEMDYVKRWWQLQG